VLDLGNGGAFRISGPLRIALLNLMTKKKSRRNQFARLIGPHRLQSNSSLSVCLTPVAQYRRPTHLESYSTVPSRRSRTKKFDGLSHHRRADRTFLISTMSPIGRAHRVCIWGRKTNCPFDLWRMLGGMAMINLFPLRQSKKQHC